MNPNNQFSGNDTPQEPSAPSDTFGASPEESNALQQVENSTPSTPPFDAQPMENPSPSPTPAGDTQPTPVSESPVAEPIAAAPVEAAPKKSKKKAIIIIASILLVLGIATASVFAYDLLTPAEEEATPVENTEQLDAEIDAIESDLNSVDDSEFSDETISDGTLQQ